MLKKEKVEDAKMKTARTGLKAATITAMALAISLLIGTGISDAQKSVSAVNNAGVMRAPMVSASSLGGQSSRMSQAPALSAASVPRSETFSALPHCSTTAKPNLPLTALPGVSVAKTLYGGRSIRLPSDRIHDPSDIIQERKFPNPVDRKHLGGPDRGDHWYSDLNPADVSWELLEIIQQEQMEAYDRKLGYGPPADSTTDSLDDLISGRRLGKPTENQKSSGGKGGDGGDNSGSGGGTTEKPKPAGSNSDTAEKPKPAEGKVKETAGQKDAKKDAEPEGDDPDEIRFAIVTAASHVVSEVINIDMVSGDNPSDRLPGKSQSATQRTYYRGLPHGREHRIGPDHHNRPDVTGSPVASLVMANPMGHAASPTPDGENPNPGPKANPVASASASVAGAIMTNPMGYAASPAIGPDGQPVNPPGPLGPRAEP